MYYKNRHSCYLLQYHLVVVTKYRHPVLVGDLRTRLFEITKEIFDTWNCTILEMNTDKDHIHIMFESPPQVPLSKLVNNFKTVSARRLRKEFSDFLAPYYWKSYFWNNSYFVCTVSDKSTSVISEYIRTNNIF